MIFISSDNSNTADSARGAIARMTLTNSRFRTRTIWIVKGVISHAWLELRIKAASYDAAIAEAHARGMSVRECVQMKQKQE